MVASPRGKALAQPKPPLGEHRNGSTWAPPTGHTVASGHTLKAGAGCSVLRAELQMEQVIALTREAEELRAELAKQRGDAEKAAQVRDGERGELVASYERMLAEQAAAVRQYEARAAHQ